MIGGANGKEAYSDLHIFYPHNFTWKTITDVRVGSPLSSIHRLMPYLSQGEPPSPRSSHCALAWGRRIIVVGGQNVHLPSSPIYNDLYLLDTGTEVITLYGGTHSEKTETNTWRFKKLKITASDSEAQVIARHACGMMGPTKVRISSTPQSSFLYC